MVEYSGKKRKIVHRMPDTKRKRQRQSYYGLNGVEEPGPDYLYETPASDSDDPYKEIYPEGKATTIKLLYGTHFYSNPRTHHTPF